jgi:Uma2 family endonuclease
VGRSRPFPHLSCAQSHNEQNLAIVSFSVIVAKSDRFSEWKSDRFHIKGYARLKSPRSRGQSPMLSTQSQQKLTFEQFLEQCPEDGRYELVNGEIVRILATRQHEDVADFIAKRLDQEVDQAGLNYKVSGRIMLATQTAEGVEQGRFPDVSVVDLDQWRSNRRAYTALSEPIQLVVEVVSTNWEDDYIDKLDEYCRLGISEYWIVDYLALGSRDYLGNPKQPSVLVYMLNDQQQYEMQRFQGGDRILSPTFPDLNLTMNEILQS